MLSNLENQLKEQNAGDKIDAVLKEIAVVQKDCGYIPLVTPTSQIVGTQAVFNVIFGRYANITKETADLVTGRYGATPAAVNADLRKKALDKMKYDEALTCRPADKIANEYDKIAADAKASGAKTDEDILTFAMFPSKAPAFFKSRDKGPLDSAGFGGAASASASGAAPSAAGKTSGSAEAYVVNVNGADYRVSVRPEGTLAIVPAGGAPAALAAPAPTPAPAAGGVQIAAPVAGTILKHAVAEGSSVASGDTIIIIESMKMELEIKSTASGAVHFLVPVGQAVQAQQALAQIG
jgi:oxaloacetate decarboxylase alpha subunit